VKCFALAVLSIAVPQGTAHAEPCVINNPFNSLTNVRAGPRIDPIMTRLKNGDPVEFIATRKDRLGSDWASVKFSKAGATGWVLRQYLDCAPRESGPMATRPKEPPVASEPSPEITATTTRLVDLKCDLHGECSGLRLGMHSDDHSCPGALGVSDGVYRIVLNYSEGVITIIRPDQMEIDLHMVCKLDQCQGASRDLHKTTKWAHDLILTKANTIIDYTYEITSEFGDGISFVLTHVYHGSCTREPPG
jgi:hypothetical protein